MGPKKKKGGKAAPPVNRGFATTSVPSKSKQAVEEQPAIEDNSSSPINQNSTSEQIGESKTLGENPIVRKDGDAGDAPKDKELHELTPEELDARLELEELSAFVDKYAAKSQRDASRHLTKLTTENRLLRTQAELLNLRSLLPAEILRDVVALANEEVAEGSYYSITQPTKPINRRDAASDDNLARLWTLQRCLLSIGFSKEAVERALKQLVRHAPSTEQSSSVWALEEALDWLALNLEEDELPAIDFNTGKSRSTQATPSDTGTPIELDVVPQESRNWKANKAATAENATTFGQTSMPTNEEEAEVEVSDVGSDLDDEEMLVKYLATKCRLYEIQPELADSKDTRKGKKGQPTGNSTASNSRGATKLLQKLDKLKSDVLFDYNEAERRWSEKRIELLKESAERKRLGVPEKALAGKSASSNDSRESRTPAESPKPIAAADDAGMESDDEEPLVGDLFAAIPSYEKPIDPASPINGDTSNLIIRDFGRTPGLSPRRILDDACHARDSAARISHQIISKSAFANRSRLVIVWSKDQSTELPLDGGDTRCTLLPRRSEFYMEGVSTPDRSQSENYVSTVALFQLFATSVKEERVYIRLPPAWRDLWTELGDRLKEKSEASDRNAVKSLRELVQSELVDDDEDTIHSANLKKRANESRSQSRPASRNGIDSTSPDVDSMKQIWDKVSSSSNFQNMLHIRQQLPMWAFKEQVISAVEANQVTILCGETGCGKSTQMPSFLLESQLSKGKACNIYCTEPRRISAITLAQRVSQELGEVKNAVGNSGSLVGYAIRLESQVASSTRLVFATTGIVLRMLESADGFNEVTHIIVDEVHERSIETDFLLIILKSLIIKRPELKVLLMSATVDSQRFASYFQGAPVLNVPGRTFPVETRYLEDAIEITKHVVDGDNSENLDEADLDFEGPGDDTKGATKFSNLRDYSNATRNTLAKYDEKRIDYELIYKLINYIANDPSVNAYSKAVLVFLPGIAEIRRMGDMISGSPLSRNFIVHLLHSTVASEDQQRAFEIPPRGLRKIVLSTNIAETGVTIPDVTCVIDTGKHKEMRFDERRQISRLVESFISRANAKQRRGRAGRVQQGLAFHLFTKSRHDESMTDQQTPEMLRLSLQDLIMRVKVCKLGDIQGTLAQALDPPQAKNIRRAIDTLIEVGALTASEDLTPLGQQLAKLPLDPYLGKLILFGSLYGCLDLALTIAAILTSKSPFVVPVDARKQGDIARLAFKKGDSDLLTEFNAYASWRRISENASMPESQFCKRNMLSLQTLCNIEDLKVQLLGQLADAGFVPLTHAERSHLPRNQPLFMSRNRTRNFLKLPAALVEHNENNELISAGLTWSFYPKLIVREGKGWRNISSSQVITLHPTSVLRSGDVSRDIKFLSYYSVLQSSSASKNYNALSLTPSFPLALIVFAATTSSPSSSSQTPTYDATASFHHTSLTISLDNGRIRLALPPPSTSSSNTTNAIPGPWKTIVGLKYLRRRMGEYMERRWRGATTSGNRAGVSVPQRLAKWVDVWDRCVQVWSEEARLKR